METDLKVSEMMDMQKKLYALHEKEWSPMTAEYGRDFILWMVEEIGESVAIIKKKGDAAIMDDPAVRADFLEEMSDVLMYYNDALLRYGVTPEEISRAYVGKHMRNVGRNYKKEYEKL